MSIPSQLSSQSGRASALAWANSAGAGRHSPGTGATPSQPPPPAAAAPTPAQSTSGSAEQLVRQPGKVAAITPCIECRERKVRCDWSQSPTQCGRCIKMNLECSGPKSIPTKPAKRHRDSAQSFAVTVRLSPSGRSHTLTTQQMSFSLSFHLIDTHYSNKCSMRWEGDAKAGFMTVWRGTGGRVSELDCVNELVARCYMLQGAQLSSHRGILGPAADLVVPEWTELKPAMVDDPWADLPSLGFRRKNALLALEDEVLDRLEALKFEDENDFAVFIFAARTFQWNLRSYKVTAFALEQMRRWMNEERWAEDEGGAGAGAVGERLPSSRLAQQANCLAAQELQMAEILKLRTILTPRDVSLFGPAHTVEFYILTDADVALILDKEAEDKPAYNALMWRTMMPSFMQIEDELNKTLLIPRDEPPFEQIVAGWALIREALDASEAFLDKITARPPTPADHVNALSLSFRAVWSHEIFLMWRLAGLHLQLQSCPFEGRTRTALLSQSLARLRECLPRIASRAAQLFTFEDKPNSLYTEFDNIQFVLRTFREALQCDWSALSAEGCQALISGLGIVSFAHADAGVIVFELRTALKRAQAREAEQRMKEAVAQEETPGTVETQQSSVFSPLFERGERRRDEADVAKRMVSGALDEMSGESGDGVW